MTALLTAQTTDIEKEFSASSEFVLVPSGVFGGATIYLDVRADYAGHTWENVATLTQAGLKRTEVSSSKLKWRVRQTDSSGTTSLNVAIV